MNIGERMMRLSEAVKVLTEAGNDFNTEDMTAYAGALIDAKAKVLAVVYDFRSKSNRGDNVKSTGEVVGN